MKNFSKRRHFGRHPYLFQILAIFLVVALSGCAKSIEPIRPREFQSPALPPPQASVANMAISIPIDVLKALLESKVPQKFRESGVVSKQISIGTGAGGLTDIWPIDGVFKDDIKVATVSAKWRADVRRGDLTISVDDNRVSIGTRLRGSITAEKAGIRETADVIADLSAISSIAVTPDWRLCTNTVGDFLAQKAEFKLFGLIPVSCQGLLEGKVKPKWNEALARFDLEVPEKVQLRPQAERIWEMCRKPLLLAKSPETWLVITPQSFSYSGFGQDGDAVRILVGLSAVVSTFVGPCPADREVGPLPPLQKGEVKPGFVINAPVKLHYGQAREIAGKVLVGRKYKVKKNVTVTLSGIDIYGNGPALVVRADFLARSPGMAFDTKGSVFLTGKLRFSPETYRLWVEELDYDLDTYNLLVKTADYLLHDDFVKSIQGELNWDIRAEVAKRLSMLNRHLVNVRIKDGIALSAQLDQADITYLATASDGILATVAFKGKSSLTFSALPQ